MYDFIFISENGFHSNCIKCSGTRTGMIAALLILLLAACDSERGELVVDNPLEADYPDRDIEWVGETDFEGVLDTNAILSIERLDYFGTERLLFIKTSQSDLLAIDLLTFEVKWKQSFRGEYTLSGKYAVFDWQGDIVLANGRKWHTLDLQTGNRKDVVNMADIEGEQHYGAFQMVDGRGYIFARTFSTGSTLNTARIYELDLETKEVEVLFSIEGKGAPLEELVLPYDEEEKKLVFAFHLRDHGEWPNGTHAVRFDIQTRNIERYHLKDIEEYAISGFRPMVYDEGILSFHGIAFTAFSFEDEEVLWDTNKSYKIRARDNYLLALDQWNLEVFDIRSHQQLLPYFYSSNLMGNLILHPTENVLCLQYSDRIDFVELPTGRLLFSHEKVEGRSYGHMFFTDSGRLGIISTFSLTQRQVNYYEWPL